MHNALQNAIILQNTQTGGPLGPCIFDKGVDRMHASNPSLYELSWDTKNTALLLNIPKEVVEKIVKPLEALRRLAG